ncbi:hypothetical protein CN646_07600 [Bacillus wiedmannii]|uniref:hypothetical protein n=1 Tax=Bacillus wiedmannii TaxID=1890302 RepID=UPI000BF16AFA|nr:hypothetical protein [Bacillus wiedmannii]PEI73452.1 hypothetical protein CN646_07600 [Bacillus wiedmannii]
MGYTFIFLLGWIIGLLTGLTERLSDKIKKNRKGEWKMEFKYTLLVSQYYHSRHMFIVKHKEDFLEQAKKCATELIEYKRESGFDREISLGDLTYFEDDTIRSRYNINDQGDIYFIQGESIQRLMRDILYYQEESIRQGRGRIKKAVLNDIAEHHQLSEVTKIVEKYFEVS